jgi:dTDP-4-dehydrorhamnose reductase
LFEIYEENIQGVLHVTGSECIKKYDYAKILADIYNFDQNLVQKISVDDIDLPAKRGKKLCLNTKKAQSLLETKLLNVKQGLEEMKKLKENGFVTKLKET